MSRPLQFFVGAWNLLEATFTAPDGSTFLPWGDAPVGTFLILETGDSSAQLMRRDRSAFASDLPTPAEKQRVYDEYFSYFGRFRADEREGTITLQVEGAMNPSWIGGEQLRHVDVEDDDHIVLRTPPLPIAGKTLVGRLRWQRRR
ncbi:MAG: lipocalin-like domain-containing protein [Rudaea sp.]